MPKYGSIEGHNCSVVENWVATYSDPIQVANGETIELDGRVDVWDGHTWLWAKNLEGKEGWLGVVFRREREKRLGARAESTHD